ncbi:MAG: PAS domain-containing protein [Syntrophobacterales bacterium]|jgi:two-component system CheB/CheR fusion protein|nr:PAS domain-containing protein [Syntrophobacterales bacterium]
MAEKTKPPVDDSVPVSETPPAAPETESALLPAADSPPAPAGPKAPSRLKAAPKAKAKPRRQPEKVEPLPTPPPLVVGVGASAGGLEAFTDLLRHLSPDTGMAFVLLQHLPPKQHSMLAQILGKATVLPVEEAREGVEPRPDHVYILPPGEVMEIRQGALRLTRRTISEGRYLPVDIFLTSLAVERGGQAIGVILSGTASDGVQGMKAIKEAGGITFAQDEQTAKYPGMPQSSVAAGCVDFVLTPEGIARELARIARHPYVSPIPGDVMKPGEEGVFSQIFNLLKRHTGVDFTFYKHSTIKRRTLRRLALLKIEALRDYLAYLQEHPDEVSALYTDILINVTSFFRDPDIFDELKHSVFPALLQDRPLEAPIRIWVPGCSTGEEVYSLAIALLEFFAESGREAPWQIFGTDIDNAAIDLARAGKFGEHVLENVSPQRLGRHFVRVDSGYQIHKSIRDRCTFARQNLIKDPPFSHLDLISCRNVLIYLGPVLQKKIIPIFHFALKSNGFLILGKSEAIGAFQEMFTLVDKKHKFYSKKDLPGRAPLKFSLEAYPEREDLSVPSLAPEAMPSGSDLMREADRIILARFAPAGVVVDEDLRILQFRGRTGPFLEPMPGEASLNLLRMVREGLRAEVGAALHQAIKGGTPVRKEGLKARYNGKGLEVNVEVFPVSPGTFRERYYLVVFEDVTPLARREAGQPAAGPRKGKRTQQDERLSDLERELAAAKEYLQATIEEQEATLEELKSTNEEIMSSNEELQSLNEELEASREELQSANEELVTMNEELENRNTELSQLNDDLTNLLGSVNLPILFLDRNLRIRRFNSMAKEVLRLIPTDVGRPLGDIKTGLDLDDLEKLLRESVDNLKIETREVQDTRGHWYQLQIRPYKTTENKIEGLVLTLADIDALKGSLKEVEEARNYAQAIIETLREPLLVLDRDLRVVSANQSFYDFFKVLPQEIEKRRIYELGGRQWNIPALRNLLEEVLPQKSVLQDLEVDAEFPPIGHRTMLLNARQIKGDSPSPPLILLVMADITARREIEAALQESERKLQALNAELMSTQESERQALSLALHEELAQNLVALKLKLRGIATGLPANRDRLKAELEEALHSIDLLVDGARELSWGLRPQVLDLGLTPAIQHLVGQFTPHLRIDTKLAAPNLDELFSPQTQIMIYRVLQEALVNVVRHAQADRVELSVERLDSEVRFRVADNGIGFQVGKYVGVDLGRKIKPSPEKAWLVGGVPFLVTDNGKSYKALPETLGVESGTHMGLPLLEGRIRLLGGTLTIASETGQGTTIAFTIPVDKDRAAV